tara:strand:- start:137 stop:304 length:168 start_codon:yes stop_codon:yes gene_type:complete
MKKYTDVTNGCGNLCPINSAIGSHKRKKKLEFVKFIKVDKISIDKNNEIVVIKAI